MYENIHINYKAQYLSWTFSCNVRNIPGDGITKKIHAMLIKKLFNAGFWLAGNTPSNQDLIVVILFPTEHYNTIQHSVHE